MALYRKINWLIDWSYDRSAHFSRINDIKVDCESSTCAAFNRLLIIELGLLSNTSVAKFSASDHKYLEYGEIT